MATATQIADAIAGRFGTAVQSWRLHNVTRKGNFVADLTPALVLDAKGGIEGGQHSCDNGRECIMQMRLSLMVDQIPGGLTALDHLALFEDRVVRTPSLPRVVYEPAQSNMLNNGGFESDTTGWSANNGAIVRTTTDAAFGSACGQWTVGATAAADEVFTQADIAGATAGLQFTLSVYVKGSGASIGKTARLVMREKGGASGSGTLGTTSVTLTADWQRVTFTGSVVQNDRTSVSLGFVIGAGGTPLATGDVMLIDGAQVEEGDTASDVETRGYSDPPEPEVVSFPLGLYQPSFSDTRYDDRGQPLVDVEGRDLTAHLLREQTDDAYSVAAATGYGAAIEAVLDLVEVRHAIPSTGFTLPVAYNRPISTPLHTIGRDLTDGINYHAPFFGLTGIAETRPRIDPAAEDAVVHYSDSSEPRMLLKVDAHADEATGVNRVVVVAEDPRRTDLAPRYVRYQNADPTSPISTETGEYSQPTELKIDSRPSTLALFDMDVAADIARYELRAAAGDARRVTITTLPDPRRGPRETYLVTQTGVVTAQKYRVLSWRRDLRVGGLMTHELAIADEVAISPWEES